MSKGDRKAGCENTRAFYIHEIGVWLLNEPFELVSLRLRWFRRIEEIDSERLLGGVHLNKLKKRIIWMILTMLCEY